MADNKKKKKKDETITINVTRKFEGNVTPIKAIIPFVIEDIKNKYEENRKLENKNDLQ